MDAKGAPFIDCPSYKWIFVGGKGGVGKTTTSCTIATELTKSRKRVLLVSTDPASNIGDVFQQHFSSEPELVNGFSNLWALEYPEVSSFSSGMSLQTIMSLPGVDELQALSSLFDSVEKDEFDVVVFDTAPTGHTMRLLQLPKSAQNILSTMNIVPQNLIDSISQMAGGGSDNIPDKMEKLQRLLHEAAERLVNPELCTFVCVTLPEFAPLYETERLLEFLTDQHIESHIMVVNQVLNEEMVKNCKSCGKRAKMQQHYLSEIHDLYNDFLIAEVGIQLDEVKGIEALSNIAKDLIPIFSPH